MTVITEDYIVCMTYVGFTGVGKVQNINKIVHCGKNGVDEGIRTPDLLGHNQAL